MRRILPLFFVLFSTSYCASSYKRNIFDVVKDKKGESLPGMSVKFKGIALGTATDLDENYSLRVPDNSTLVITYIGYVIQEVAVINQTQIPKIS